MTIIDALETPTFQLPKKRNNDSSLIACLEKFYEDFKTLISQIHDGEIAQTITSEMQNLDAHCEYLKESLIHYKKGQINKSFICFENSMKCIEKFLFPINENKVKVEGWKDPFYRARIGNNSQFTREQMFHRSQNEQEFIMGERFSVYGIPCLYLSNSIYVCWEELNRPAFSTLMISRFHLENDDIRILDISFTPKVVNTLIKTYLENGVASQNTIEKLFMYFIMTWPLTVSCTMMVVKEDGTFKPEYVFPQLLMEWISLQNNIDGIKYFSVKSNPYNTGDFSKFINYAFPTKDVDDQGFSEFLRRSFKLTEPISWELLQLSDPSLINFENYVKPSVMERKYVVSPFDSALLLELIRGYKMPYVNTLFGKMEWILSSDKFEVDWI